jgi:hypothetical protein
VGGSGYRCFGEYGLMRQLGSAAYAKPRKFREKLERWLNLIRAMWPGRPARIDNAAAVRRLISDY